MDSRVRTAGPGVLLGRADGPADLGGALSRAEDGTVALAPPAHLLTIAPNLSAKTAACVAPTLLGYDGQAVVLDVNGQSYAATADARREMGQTVVRLDPFGVLGPETDSLDPFDLLAGLESPALETACQDLAALVIARDVFGDPAGADVFGLLCAVIGYLAVDPEKRTFDAVYATMHQDDTVYNLAVVLDTIGKKIPSMSYAEISAWLQREDGPRSRILQGVQSYLKVLGVPQVRQAVSRSTVPIDAVREGAPVTFYLVVPPERLVTSGVLLRLWVGTLLHTALRARAAAPMLVVLDNCAALGSFPLVQALLGSRPADGCRIWTFWHDVRQLRTAYPAAWPEMVSGCGAVQVFGTKDSAAASEAEVLLGLAANEVWSLGPGEQVVHADGVSHRLRNLGR